MRQRPRRQPKRKQRLKFQWLLSVEEDEYDDDDDDEDDEDDD